MPKLACIWEATARKPGNVHRFCDFDDTTYLDFLDSARLPSLRCWMLLLIIESAIRYWRECGEPGRWFARTAISAFCSCWRRWRKRRRNRNLRAGLGRVLDDLDVEDSRQVYEAIRLANPSGLGQAAEQDIKEEPTLPLREVMALAAGRDLIARQYVSDFREVFDDGARRS